MTQFPNAEKMKTTSPPGDDIRNSPGQRILPGRTPGECGRPRGPSEGGCPGGGGPCSRRPSLCLTALDPSALRYSVLHGEAQTRFAPEISQACVRADCQVINQPIFPARHESSESLYRSAVNNFTFETVGFSPWLAFQMLFLFAQERSVFSIEVRAAEGRVYS